MTTMNWRLLPALAIVAAVAAAGCGDDATGPGDPAGAAVEMAIDMNLEDGGMGSGPEAPGFGDGYFSRHLQGNEPFADPLEQDPRMGPLESRPGASVQYLRVVWGNQRGAPEASDDTTAGPVLDWRGMAVVSDGLLIPLQVIAFERGDRLVLPERPAPGMPPRRQTVAWISRTTRGRDGVLLKIVVPPARDTTFAEARGRLDGGNGLTPDDTFTFDTDLLEVSFPLVGLARLDTTIYVDADHGVSFTGFDRDDASVCPRGAVLGAWSRVAGDSLGGGFFRAKWEGPLGEVRGHLRGRWGTLVDGQRVFVGKMIDTGGAYAGHVRGTWARDDADPTRGTFNGQWKRLEEGQPPRALGTVHGVWGLSDEVEDGGFMRGQWKSACAGKEDD